MGTATIRVDPSKWDLFLKLYPKQASKLVRDYIDNLIVNAEPLTDSTSEEQISSLIQENLVISANAKIKADVLSAQLQEVKARSEKQTLLEMEKETELEEAFRLNMTDTTFAHTFKHKYIMSGSKDKGISELDFYKQEFDKRE